MTVLNWAINMNVQANRTKKINKMNIYIKHNLATIPFKFIIGNGDTRQYSLSLKLQLSGQTSNFVMASKCEQRLAYASGG